MGILSRHLDKGEPVEINGEKIMLKGLGIEYIEDFMTIMKDFMQFKGKKDGEVSKVFSKLSDNTVKSMKNLVKGTLEKTFPNEPVDERDQFGMKYFFTLLFAIIEINSDMMNNLPNNNKIKLHKKIKELQKNK